MKKLLPYSLAFLVAGTLASVSYAEGSISGKVVMKQAGDMGCYVDLQTEDETVNFIAPFEVCEDEKIAVGAEVTADWTMKKIDNCNGDTGCGEYTDWKFINNISLEEDDEDDAAVSAPQNPVKRIQFAKGASAQTLNDAVVRGTSNEYLLGVAAGQTIKVSVTSLEDNAVFNVFEPGKSVSAVGSEEHYELKNWSGVTKKGGDYVIVVGATRGNAEFKMTVAVE